MRGSNVKEYLLVFKNLDYRMFISINKSSDGSSTSTITFSSL